jgi:hypothetical protein
MYTMYWSRSVVKLAMFAVGLAIAAWGSVSDASEHTGEMASEVRATSACTQPLPSEIAVPEGTDLEIELSAVGTQLYTCTATPGGAAWVFTAPKANLYDRRGMLAGTHNVGPTWESNDGSTVGATKVSGVTVDPTAIPWLMLGAASHDGRGEMDRVTHIQRVSTVGGIAPTSGCDAASIGNVTRVPYTATYCFYDKE